MQSFGTFLSDNKGLAIGLAVLAIIVATTILIFLYRLVFGRRLHMAGGRARQPRLGVVDAFDLDRQRQLVLVRRDNVEHLLMIGGPNDLMIESAFVRAQPSVAVPPLRDKETVGTAPLTVPMPFPVNGGEPATAVELRPSDGQAGPVAQPLPDPARATPPIDLAGTVSAKDLGPLADIPAPGPPPAAPPPPAEPAGTPPPAPTIEPGAQVEPPAPLAAPTPPAARPLPQRPGSPLPRPAGSPLPPRPPLGALRTPGANGGSSPVPPRPPSLLPNRPMPLSPLQRGTSAASLRREPPPTSPDAPNSDAPTGPRAEAPATAPSEPAAVVAAPVPGPEPAPPVVANRPPPGLPVTLDSIESLEEEMAKLLGRASTGDKR